jgi:hypothetical protein
MELELGSGIFEKSEVSLVDGMAHYELLLSDKKIKLNQYLGKKISLSFKGVIRCSHCGEVTKKSFGGFCYKHSQSLAQADLCYMQPHFCHFAKGTCREPDWGKSVCFAPHYVYLSNTSGIKVGITRENQIPTRWIDQGAIQGLAFLKVHTRFQSGLIEKLLSEKVMDKTDWRKMLKSAGEKVDMNRELSNLMRELGDEIESLEDEIHRRDGERQIEWLKTPIMIDINYPVLKYPVSIKSISFDDNPLVEGTLLGIKGQYLYFDHYVFNMRKHTGYEFTMKGEQ